MTRGCFTTADGCVLHYVDEGAGMPVLWQHGLGATQAQAAEVFPARGGLRRITLECRGHASSAPGPREALSIPQFADDAMALLDRLGVQRAVVGGISLGAAIALRIAVRQPERVTGIVVARPAWLGESAPERMRIYLDVAELLRDHGESGLQRLVAGERYRQVVHESPDNAASMRNFFQRERESTVALLSQLPSQGSGVSRGEISRLLVPTLVIASERDFVHPVSLATEVARLIPGARLEVLPAKDLDREGYVSGFRAALEDFLSRHEARAPRA